MKTAADLIYAIELTVGRAGRRTGRNVRLLCPAHDDHDPSLDVAEGDDGRPLVQCRSHGCSFEDIVTAAGLDPTDFAPDAGAGEWTPYGPAIERYPYTDERGVLLFEILRTADKQFPGRVPDSGTKTGWRWKLGDVERVPYHLPALVESARAGGTVYVAEGEKDVHALEKIGLTATCNPGGAGKWRRGYDRWFLGAERVVVVADDDAAGRAHALDVASSLRVSLADAAATVDVVLPAVGKDAADHVNMALDADAFRPLEESAEPELAVLLLTPVVVFAEVNEPTALPLLGSADETVIPVGGDVIAYGTGGAGKTTLSLDAAFHLAAGESWLGMDVPRPMRVAVIENEGPRGQFRLKLRRKLAAWNGNRAELDEDMFVMEEPWGGFTFADERHRQYLADALNERACELLLCGPVSTVGMIGGGTPDEINAFVGLIAELRYLLNDPLAVWLIHHENRSGQVSGAWERVPDALCHVTSRGNGHTRVFWQKARWSAEHHGTTMHLAWTDAYGFEIEEAPVAATPERQHEQIEEHVLGHGGCGWTDVKDAVPGQAKQLVAIRDRMLADGTLVNLGSGRAFKLWHRSDPALPMDAVAEKAREQQEIDIPF